MLGMDKICIEESLKSDNLSNKTSDHSNLSRAPVLSD